MPSINQIIAEIQLTPDLPPNHKVKAVQIIRDAEERLKLKTPRAPRKITGAKGLVTLDKWEAARGKELHWTDLDEWAAKYQLDELSVKTMIEEFRADMLSKGKQYANFSVTFQVYMRRGYLSKTLEACRRRGNTVIETRGINL